MNKKRLLKGTVIPVAMICAAMLWSPMGVSHASAAVDEVQQHFSLLHFSHISSKLDDRHFIQTELENAQKNDSIKKINFSVFC